MALSGDIDKSITHYNRAIKINPEYAEAINNLGAALLEKSKYDDAEDLFKQAIILAPENAESHNNLAFTQLLLGDFENGWKEYEWRWKCKDFHSKRRNFDQPLWDGSSLKEKTILLHTEQGLGDTIQFMRYVPSVKKYGGKIFVECEAKMAHLFHVYRKFATFIVKGDTLPKFDVHSPLLSLPFILKTTLKTIPSKVGYIHSDPSLSKKWDKKISNNKKIKLGICWQGNKEQKHDHKRSIPLHYWKTLLDKNTVDFISLQKGYGQEQIKKYGYKKLITDYSNIMDNGKDAFVDTAPIIDNLDLIISSDTAIPHLAGAMNKPIWLLLPYSPDWRWLLDGSESPWYPSMRLFRQKELGNWHGVFNEVSIELDKFISGKATD